MADLPHPWAMYARLQTEILRSSHVSSQSWGAEAAMNHVLAAIQDNRPPTSDEVARTAASARRQVRYRAHLRLIHLPANDTVLHPEDMLVARHELHAVRSKISEPDWSLLCQVAEGHGYAELASAIGGTPGCLRVRVTRLRRYLAA